MIPPAFDYHAPRSVSEAVGLLGSRRQAAGRRPQPAADDEAALRAARAPDRPEPHRRAARHLRGRRRRRHRCDDGRERPDRQRHPAGQGAAAGRGAEADRRPAGAQPRHHRRRHRPRRPGQRPPGAEPGRRRHLRAAGAQGHAPGEGRGFLPGDLHDRAGRGRDPGQHPRAGLRRRHRLGLREAQAQDRRLGHRRRRGGAAHGRRQGDACAHRADQRGADRAARHRCRERAHRPAAERRHGRRRGADLRGDRDYKTAMAGHMVKRAIRAAAARCR